MGVQCFVFELRLFSCLINQRSSLVTMAVRLKRQPFSESTRHQHSLGSSSPSCCHMSSSHLTMECTYTPDPTASFSTWLVSRHYSTRVRTVLFRELLFADDAVSHTPVGLQTSMSCNRLACQVCMLFWPSGTSDGWAISTVWVMAASPRILCTGSSQLAPGQQDVQCFSTTRMHASVTWSWLFQQQIVANGVSQSMLPPSWERKRGPTCGSKGREGKQLQHSPYHSHLVLFAPSARGTATQGLACSATVVFALNNPLSVIFDASQLSSQIDGAMTMMNNCLVYSREFVPAPVLVEWWFVCFDVNWFLLLPVRTICCLYLVSEVI